MIEELKTLKRLTKLIVDNPMEIEYNGIIKATLNALPYPIFIVDIFYNIKFANNYVALYFNIDIDEIIDKKYIDVFSNINYNPKEITNSINKKNLIGVKDPFYLPNMKKFPMFNKHNKTIGYVCVISTKQSLNTNFDLKQSVLYANSLLSTTTFNSESIAMHCDLKNNFNIMEIFSASKPPYTFSWLEGKSYINDITYVLDRNIIESYVKTLTEKKDKNIIWNGRIYNKDKNILKVQQCMSFQNNNLLIHIASNANGNIELELS